MSNKYQDYVIKNGEFVGAFDEMYKEASEVPWHQDRTAYSLIVDIDLTILKHNLKNHNKEILDVGCGLGYVTNRIKEIVPGSNITGVDVSSEAIRKAQKMFPHLAFETCDLSTLIESGSCIKHKRFDFIYIKDVVWYVVECIDVFFRNVFDLLADDGKVYIMQSFPSLEKYYGQDVFPDPNTLLDYLSKSFEVLYSQVSYERYTDSRENRVVNDYPEDVYLRFLGKK
jgi:predicted TPR repeat methyltransferase